MAGRHPGHYAWHPALGITIAKIGLPAGPSVTFQPHATRLQCSIKPIIKPD